VAFPNRKTDCIIADDPQNVRVLSWKEGDSYDIVQPAWYACSSSSFLPSFLFLPLPSFLRSSQRGSCLASFILFSIFQSF
jgi:hypothetical protein